MKTSWLILLLIVATASAQETPAPWPVLEEVPAAAQAALPDTALLDLEGDLSTALVDGVHRFVDREIADSGARREEKWPALLANPESARERLRRMIGLPDGMADAEAPGAELEFLSDDREQLALGESEPFVVYEVRWPAFREVTGVGLLLEPKKGVRADVVLLPDAGQEPERLVKDLLGDPEKDSLAGRLAADGFRVLVPLLIGRGDSPDRMSWREYVYRPAFELGRHIVGYEVAKTIAGFRFLAGMGGVPERPSVVIGHGEGGLVALHAAAIDPSIDAVWVSGYFGPREGAWDEPAYRNFFGQLEEFGAAEVAALVAPRALLVEAAPGPDVLVAPLVITPEGRPERGSPNGKPGHLAGPSAEAAGDEFFRLKRILQDTGNQPLFFKGQGFGEADTQAYLLGALGLPPTWEGDVPEMEWKRDLCDPEVRQRDQIEEIIAHNEWLLREASYRRDEFMKELKTGTLEEFAASVESYRDVFRDEVIGHFDRALLPPNPRSRSDQSGEGVRSYEVVLDVFPDVIAYGILTVPEDLPLDGSEVRPCVVCQHGLEGRPQDVIGESKYSAYKAFATRLAQEGFVTFAPQNLYLGQDRFRLLQFKLQSVGKTLFSVIVPQHEQIVSWLGELPFVDADRIGFYGLSYGGKSAMRIPPLVEGYALSICSADFNEWIWKNCSTRSPYSYANKREYEIFEWNLGMTFNYAEMAALIAPRPFMVERGHFDGVAPDEKVAHEFAKVRRLYGLLGIGDRAEIEWFIGPHTINGEGTYAFLRKWLGRE